MRNIEINKKTDAVLAQGESFMGIFFTVVFAILGAVWLGHATVEDITGAVEHKPHEVNLLKSLGIV